MDNRVIGPALPPHLLNPIPNEETRDCGNSDFLSPESTSNKEDADLGLLNDYDIYGPVLPPHLRKKSVDNLVTKQNIIGPSIPPGMLDINCSINECGSAYEHSHDCDDSDLIGPPIPGSGINSAEMSSNHQKLEMRARYLKRKLAESVGNLNFLILCVEIDLKFIANFNETVLNGKSITPCQP